MFYDWLTIYQDHEGDLSMIGDRATITIDTVTGTHLGTSQPIVQHEGSYCTSIQIRVSANRVTVKGNPSRINRLDNLFGLTSLDECVAVYNRVLISLGLPPFTKCTRVFHRANEADRVEVTYDGAMIQELHITSNRSAGEGCADDYIRGLSTLRYRHIEPRLHTNGKTADWLSVRNHEGRASSLMYPTVYNKAFDMALHLLPKISKKYGPASVEDDYVRDLIEHKLKSKFLARNNFRFYGLFDEAGLKPFHDDFLNIDENCR